jgi:hypothetical protein
MRWVRAGAVLALLAVLAGCVQRPEIPYDRSASAIKVIGLLPPKVPDGPKVILASTVGQSFGLIGALVDAGMQANRDSKFEDLMKHADMSASDVVSKTLSANLQAAGYKVSEETAVRDGSGFFKHYPKDDSGKVDAYLDVVVNGYGYVAAGIGSSTPYRPAVFAQARLVKASDSTVLMEDTFLYNPVGSPDHVVTIAPDPRFEFADFDSLMADPQHASADLRSAVEESMATIVKLLR